MASSETYSNTSLINIATDPFVVNTGTVTRSGGKLVLSPNSRCTFTKTFSDNGISTNKLKVNYNVDASNLVTRYNNNISIQLKVHYLNRDYENGEYVYSDGKWQTIDIIPYTSDEEKGNYKEDIIDTAGSYVKSIDTIIRYEGTGNRDAGTMDLTKLNIFNTVDIDEEALTQEVESNLGIRDYINGLIDTKMQQGCYIRLLQTQAELATVQEGELCRCAWIS